MSNPVLAARVQEVTTNVTALQASIAQAITVTNAGDCLVAYVVNATQTSGYAASVVSGAGATWYLGVSKAGTVGVIDIWYGLNASSGAQTVTITMNGVTPTTGCTVQEWSGIAAAPAIEAFTSTNATSTTPNLTLSPANLGDVLLILSDAPAETASPTGLWTAYVGPTTTAVQKNGIAYQVASTVTPQIASWTVVSGAWTTCGIILKAAQPTGYAILNATSASVNAGYTNQQASPDYVDSIISAGADNGTGVLSGLAVSPNTGHDLKFQVASGVAFLGSAPVAVASVTAQSVTTADSTNPRRDLVYVTDGAVVTYVAGQPAAVPCIPTLPLNSVALATIEVPASAASVTYPGTSSTAYVNDKRVTVGLPISGRDYYLKPTAALFETFPRQYVNVTTAAIGSTGVLFMNAVFIPAGVTIGHISFFGGGAASVPSHWWFNLCDNNFNQLAATADQTSTAWGANTQQTLAIATTAQGPQSTFTTAYTGLHYIGIMMTANTIVTIAGITSAQQILTGVAPTLGGASTASLTTVPTFPTTFSTPPGSTRLHYAYVGA